MKRALLALESAREINENAGILPSYKVFPKLLRAVVAAVVVVVVVVVLPPVCSVLGLIIFN